MKHTLGKEKSCQCLGSSPSSPSSFSVTLKRNSFLRQAILGLMTQTGMSPCFLSFLTPLCRQLRLCVSAWFYRHGNGGRGKPVIICQNLTKKFLRRSRQQNQRRPRIEVTEPRGLIHSAEALRGKGSSGGVELLRLAAKVEHVSIKKFFPGLGRREK